jgi:hypothetical protein
VNLKMVFEILTNKEIEALKERAIRKRNFYAANLLRWEAEERSQPMAKPVQSSFCTLQRGPRHAGWSQHPGTGANAPVGSRPLDGANG